MSKIMIKLTIEKENGNILTRRTILDVPIKVIISDLIGDNILDFKKGDKIIEAYLDITDETGEHDKIYIDVKKTKLNDLFKS